jgi:hypothetical protein
MATKKQKPLSPDIRELLNIISALEKQPVAAAKR